MRQFILASGYGDSAGQVTLVNDKTLGGANLVLKRDASKGGDILYPIYPKEFTYIKSDPYKQATSYQGSFSIEEVTESLIYTVTFVKKGKQFNERNKWTFTTRSTKKDTATSIGDALVKWAENNKSTLGLKVTNSAGTITVEGVKKGEPYHIVLGDELLGVKVTETGATSAFMDAAMIRDLANKCAADAGFEYTYDDFEGFYPNFNLNPLAQADAEDKGFIVYTLRFTEPRLMGTREESVYQIVQVAFPTGGDGDFESKIKEFLGENVATAAEIDEDEE